MMSISALNKAGGELRRYSSYRALLLGAFSISGLLLALLHVCLRPDDVQDKQVTQNSVSFHTTALIWVA
jgi:hypothetical protein